MTMKTTTRMAYLAGFVLVAGVALLLRHREEAPSPSAATSPPSNGKSHRIQPDAPKDERPPAPDRKTGHRESLTVDELVTIFNKDGADAALAAAKGITGPDRDSQVLFILTYIARTDPEWAAKALADAGLSVVHQGFVVSAVMDRWTDGEKALAWASGFTGNLRKTAVGMALRILVKSHPEAALAHVESLPDSGSRSQALLDLFISWGEHDPKAALDHLEGDLSPDERDSAIRYIAAGWARKSPAEVIAWLGTLQGPAMSALLIQDVALALPEEDAKTWLATLPDDSTKTDVLNLLAAREQMAIRCGVDQAPPDQSWKGKPVSEMTTNDLRNWGWQDPASAKKYLEGATGEIDLGDLASTVAAGMSGKEGPAAVFKWAQGLDTKAGNSALRLAIISWAGNKPAEAAEAIDQVTPERRPALASALAETWTRNDPAAAAAWVANYPGSDQKTLVREVLQQWAASEPREAYAWLNTLPAGESRDEGISYMIIREAPSNPEWLAPWIELLSTPELRAEKRKVLDEYARSTPAVEHHGE
jgi:hypothetical protein